MKTIEIDGSLGEGGGQILRTALSLSCITGHPLKLFNIRKRRKKHGLMPQHITCVNAVAEISIAEVSGNQIGSTELLFIPKKVNCGSYNFDIKTAGSSSLVLQTLLPPLILTDGPSHIKIKGGTHVPFSPTYHYISRVFIPMLNRIGLKVESSINKYGFYPKGGGEVSFKIFPVKEIKGLKLLSRGNLLFMEGLSGISRLPISIAERQKRSLIEKLHPLSANVEILNVSYHSEGTFVFLKARYENTLSGFSSLGRKGKPAEDVGREVAQEFISFNKTAACLDPHLTDQIVIYLSLSQNASSFTTSCITQHLITNLKVIEKFVKINCRIDGGIGSEGIIDISPSTC